MKLRFASTALDGQTVTFTLLQNGVTKGPLTINAWGAANAALGVTAAGNVISIQLDETASPDDPIVVSVDGTVYSEDIEGNTLTAALITARPRFLKRPSISGAGLVGSTAVGTLGLVLKTDALLEQTFEWRRNGLTETEAQTLDYSVGISDSSSSITLSTEIGGTSATSDPLLVQAGGLTQDSGAIWWHDPDNVVVSSGKVQSWPNSAMNGSTKFGVSSVPAGDELKRPG